MTIQEIKREHNKPARRTRSPLTHLHLLRLLHHLESSDYDLTLLRAAFTLAFAGFLRVGEFTYQEADIQLGLLFHKWFITKASIRISVDSTHMGLTLPASKTDPFRKGIKLTIAASQDKGCPVDAIKQLRRIDTHRPSTAPLFCVGRHNQSPFSREYVVFHSNSEPGAQALARGHGMDIPSIQGLQLGPPRQACLKPRSTLWVGGDLTPTNLISNTRARSGLYYLGGSSIPSHRTRPANDAHQPASIWRDDVTTARHASPHFSQTTCLGLGYSGGNNPPGKGSGITTKASGSGTS